MRQTATGAAALGAALVLGCLLTGGCGNGANKGANIHMPPTPQQKIQEIQNDPHMPPQAKAQAIAAYGGSPGGGAGAPPGGVPGTSPAKH